MTVTLHANGVTGRAAIYTFSKNNTVLNNPYSYLNLIKMHSDLGYLSFKPAVTKTLVVAAGSGNVPSKFRSLLMGSHGQSGVPFCKATFRYDTISNLERPMIGAVPVVWTVNDDGLHIVTLTLGISAGSLFVIEQRSHAVMPSTRNIIVTAYVSDTVF